DLNFRSSQFFENSCSAVIVRFQKRGKFALSQNNTFGKLLKIQSHQTFNFFFDERFSVFWERLIFTEVEQPHFNTLQTPGRFVVCTSDCPFSLIKLIIYSGKNHFYITIYSSFP